MLDEEQNEQPPQVSLTFTLADSKRQNCQNLKLDEHGIELCLRRPHLSLPFNRSKTLPLRVIRAAAKTTADEDSQ